MKKQTTVTVEATYEEVVTGVTLELDANTARLLTALLTKVNLARVLATDADVFYRLYDALDNALRGDNRLGEDYALYMLGSDLPLPVVFLRPVRDDVVPTKA